MEWDGAILCRIQCDPAQKTEQSLLNLRTHYENNGSKRTGVRGDSIYIKSTDYQVNQNF